MILAGLGILIAGCGGDDSSGGVMPAPEAATLLDVQVRVFSPRCALSGCHTGTGSPFGLDLSSVAASSASIIDVDSAEMPSLRRIEPFNAPDSYLYMKLVDDPRIFGDAMPLSGPPLGAGDVALIETWINDGAN
jgi:hypothetical protein